jgi:glycosyltransferase involved in cell wall biosynthesis
VLELAASGSARSTAPAVSVIMPTFNRLRYLPAAVESVFAQTFQDWELIIADDGSDEETKTYLKALHHPPRIKVIWLSHTGNPGAVRNAALRSASGEYIAFLDSDDFWLPRKLEMQIRALRQSPARQWSCTAFTMVDADGKPLATESARRWTARSGAIFKQLLRQEIAVTTPTVLAVRQLVERAGRFHTRQLLYEDYDLWSRLALLSEVEAIETPLTHVRKHAEHYGGTVRTPAVWWWRAKWRWNVVRAVLCLYLPHRLRARYRPMRSKSENAREAGPA